MNLEEENSKPQAILTTLISVFTIIGTPIILGLYILGLGYYQGVLEGKGLFYFYEYPSYQEIYLASYILIRSLSESYTALILALLFLMIMAASYLTVIYVAFNWINSKSKSFNKLSQLTFIPLIDSLKAKIKFESLSTYPFLVNAAFKFCFYTFLLLIMLWVNFKIPQFAYDEGFNKGEEIVKGYSSCLKGEGEGEGEGESKAHCVCVYNDNKLEVAGYPLVWDKVKAPLFDGQDIIIQSFTDKQLKIMPRNMKCESEYKKTGEK